MPFSLSPQPPSTVAAGEELLFTNSSFTTHTGGAIFGASSSGGGQQQSSSVPVTSVLISSPLQVRTFPSQTAFNFAKSKCSSIWTYPISSWP